ncbi:MAG: DegT/DnrJ/EryC1/StrS family aminotransferase [Nitrospirota bacterium]
MEYDIPILMSDVKTASDIYKNWQMTTSDPFGCDTDIRSYFGPTARWLLSACLDGLHLLRSDNIAILTTTNATYVPTCLTIASFNFCGVSRVVTQHTRVAIIVHEHGFSYPSLREVCEALRLQGITIIEDCAHVFGLPIDDNCVVGSFGDYALFSLSKIFPCASGGLIRSRRSLKLPDMTNAEAEITRHAKEVFVQWLPYYKELNNRRMSRHNIIASLLGQQNIEIHSNYYISWMTYFKTDAAIDLKTPLSKSIEFGATLRDDLILIPTNPLVEESRFMELAGMLRKEMHDYDR